ncbi:recombinase family protein [Solibacillus sp. FSL W7-1436]|uniref:recombinase family protein n=1 Tax=Solibacillus sp. FSL W7-1436 TaxID=2921705 RepID=UPI0040487605
MIIGYARVSSKEQNLQRQIEALEQYGCEKIFTEKESGKDFNNRAVYQALKKKLRFGDIFVVKDLSRFGRTKVDIINEWKWFQENEIDIIILDMPILNTTNYKNVEGIGTLVSDIVLNLLSWMVEEERTRIKKAQAEGIKIAKEQGKYKGRPVKYSADATGQDKVIYDTIIRMLNNNSTIMDIHRYTNVSRPIIYKIRDELNEAATV